MLCGKKLLARSSNYSADIKFVENSLNLLLLKNYVDIQERSSLLKRLEDMELNRTIPDDSEFDEPLSITGLETFCLSYKVCSSCSCPSLCVKTYTACAGI